MIKHLLLPISKKVLCSLLILIIFQNSSYSQSDVALQLSKSFNQAETFVSRSVVQIGISLHDENDSSPKDKNPQNKPAEPLIPTVPDSDQFKFKPEGFGTGFIVTKDGLIITNHHVVGEAKKIQVRLWNDKSYDATLVSKVPQKDIAIIKINAEGLIPIKVGKSDDLFVGTWVLAVGYPFGLDRTITAGIISAKKRALQGNSVMGEFIQTDAPINPGNSGGPLINLNGEVIGINTSIFSPNGGSVGIGFAIPIEVGMEILKAYNKNDNPQPNDPDKNIKDQLDSILN